MLIPVTRETYASFVRADEGHMYRTVITESRAVMDYYLGARLVARAVYVRGSQVYAYYVDAQQIAQQF